MVDNFNKDAIRLKKNFVRYRCEIRQNYIDSVLSDSEFSSVSDLLNSTDLVNYILRICKKLPSVRGNISNVAYMSVLCELLDQIEENYNIYICCALPVNVKEKSFYSPTFANYMYISCNGKDYHYFNGADSKYITIIKSVEVEV